MRAARETCGLAGSGFLVLKKVFSSRATCGLLCESGRKFWLSARRPAGGKERQGGACCGYVVARGRRCLGRKRTISRDGHRVFPPLRGSPCKPPLRGNRRLCSVSTSRRSQRAQRSSSRTSSPGGGGVPTSPLGRPGPRRGGEKRQGAPKENDCIPYLRSAMNQFSWLDDQTLLWSSSSRAAGRAARSLTTAAVVRPVEPSGFGLICPLDGAGRWWTVTSVSAAPGVRDTYQAARPGVRGHVSTAITRRASLSVCLSFAKRPPSSAHGLRNGALLLTEIELARCSPGAVDDCSKRRLKARRTCLASGLEKPS
jgi:hypothetical protein